MATTQQKLDAAREAYHDLLTGNKARVVVDQNGERVEFTPANRDALRAYIRDLEDEVNAVTRTRGPMKVWGS